MVGKSTPNLARKFGNFEFLTEFHKGKHCILVEKE